MNSEEYSPHSQALRKVLAENPSGESIHFRSSDISTLRDMNGRVPLHSGRVKIASSCDAPEHTTENNRPSSFAPLDNIHLTEKQ